MRKMKFVIDADTLLVRSAALCQNNFDVVNKETQEIVSRVTSMKAFYEAVPESTHHLFEFVPNVSPATPTVGSCPSVIGKHALRLQIEKILKDNEKWIDSYKIVLHGEGNFRYSVATIAPYKGHRKEKPMFFQKVKDWALKEYKDNLILAYDEEADDICAQIAYQEYLRVGPSPKKFNVCIAGVDKDLLQIVSHHYNYDKNEYQWVTREEAAYNFYTQLLKGDSSDNITGLVDLPKEARKEYGLRGKGIGDKAAERILEGCESPKEMMERVVSCYEMQYGDKWYDVMEENCRLLYLTKVKGEVYNLGNKLKAMGIDYER